MNLQESFNKGVAGLAAQDFVRSKCAYRGPNGRKCFIGHLIPDELYTGDMDDPEGGMNVKTLFDIYPELKPHLVPDGMGYEDALELLGMLQRAHDSANDAEGMKSAYRLFARKNGLQYPAVLNPA